MGNIPSETILNLIYDSINRAIKVVGSSFGLASDSTHDSAANATVIQTAAESKDFDGAALPNATDEGDATRPAVTLSGVPYAFLVNEDGSKTPVDSAGNLKAAGYTPPVVALISSAQELDATPTDMGAEIDMQGCNQLGLWLTVDIGTSTNVTIRILHKHTSAGAEEYREIYLGSPSANLTTINLNDYQVASDADQNFKINIPVSATTPYIQIQVYDAADGDGQIDAAYYTKSYAS